MQAWYAEINMMRKTKENQINVDGLETSILLNDQSFPA